MLPTEWSDKIFKWNLKYEVSNGVNLIESEPSIEYTYQYLLH